MIDSAQERIEHHQDEDGDKPENQGKEHAGGGNQDAGEVDLLQQARRAGEALAALHQGLGEKVVVQDADHQIEDVVGQIAAKDMGENEVIDKDHGQRIAQGPEEAQSRALIAHLEVFGDQIAHQIAVLPVTGKAGGGGTGRGDGAGLHERNCACCGGAGQWWGMAKVSLKIG